MYQMRFLNISTHRQTGDNSYQVVDSCGMPRLGIPGKIRGEKEGNIAEKEYLFYFLLARKGWDLYLHFIINQSMHTSATCHVDMLQNPMHFPFTIFDFCGVIPWIFLG